jgi:hypothetical protein
VSRLTFEKWTSQCYLGNRRIALWKWISLIDPIFSHGKSIIFCVVLCPKPSWRTVEFYFCFVTSVVPEHPYFRLPIPGLLVEPGYSDDVIAAIKESFHLSLPGGAASDR